MLNHVRATFVLPIMIVVGIVGSILFFKKSEKLDHFVLDTHVTHLDNVVPVAIIGSGPAGLSAALYIARAGMKALVFAGPTPCGQLTQTTYIENWPGREKVLGIDLMNDVKRQAELFGAMIINDTVTSVDFSKWPYEIYTEEDHSVKALSVIVTTGAHPKQLSVPGEKKYWAKGVTTCAVCDAPFFVQKDVVVVGGGDSAAEEVFELAPYVNKVTLLVRGEAMRAAAVMQKRVQSYDNVEICYNQEIQAIYGDETSVTSVDIVNNKDQSVRRLEVQGVFLAVGHTPNTEIFKKYLDVDSLGYLQMKGRTQQTSKQGIFAAGEVQDNQYRQAAVAAGEGIKAALDAASFLYEIGFNSKVGQALENNFFESFSDDRVEIKDIRSLEDFQKHVLDNEGLVVLDFYSKTCPGCVKVLPAVESLAYHLGEKITVLKCNGTHSIDILRELKYHMGITIRSVPTILIFKNGKFLNRTSSIMSKKELMVFVHQYLKD
jgi:thioredoxin reductase (NADPH)